MLFTNLMLSSTCINLIACLTRQNLVMLSIFFGILSAKFQIIYNPEMIDFGIIMTMLIVGSHVDADILKKQRKNIILISIITLITTFLSFFVIQHLLICISEFNAFIISGSLCLSSTIVCHNELMKKNRIITNYGQITLIGTIIQDLFGIFLIILTHTKGKFIKLETIIIYLILFFIFIISTLFENKIYEFLNKTKTKFGQDFCSNLIMHLLIIIYIICVKLEHIHISTEIVFFIFGYIFKKLIKISNNYLIIFQGISLSLVYIVSGYNLYSFNFIFFKDVLELTFLLTIIKFIVSYIVFSLFNKEEETNVNTSILLSSFSELSFFILMWLDIESEIKNIIVLATTISMITIPLIFDKIAFLFNEYAKKNFGIAQYSARVFLSKYENYSLVVGIEPATKKIMSKLSEKMVSVFVIDNDIQKVLDYGTNQCFYMDARLKEAYLVIDLIKVKSIIVGCENINTSHKIIHTIRNLDQKVIIYVLCYSIEFIGISKKYNCNPIILEGGDLDTRINDFVEVVLKSC